MNKYMFRAESLTDVFEFLCGMEVNQLQSVQDISIKRLVPDTPDRVVSFSTNASHSDLIEFATQSDLDLHVIAETLELHEDYTGERKYGRASSV